MVQHLSDEVFAGVLKNCYRKLKSGGRLILHIQLTDNEWRTEDEWRADTSIKGKLKYKYGLHCFGRTEERHREMVKKAGFEDIVVREIGEYVPEEFDDVCSQSLLTARKPAAP
jgi:cyclopropane fatty-acyl-phospholipid synthase-like methyltransferase